MIVKNYAEFVAGRAMTTTGRSYLVWLFVYRVLAGNASLEGKRNALAYGLQHGGTSRVREIARQQVASGNEYGNA